MPTPALLDAAERAARVLDCGLTRPQLAAVAALIETGANPEVRVGWGGGAGRNGERRPPPSDTPIPISRLFPQAVAAAVRALQREAASLQQR